MTTSRIRAAVALAIAAFTAACGGGDGASGPSFPDSVSTADAQDFADGVASYADQVAYGINFNGPSVGLAAPAMATRLQSALHPMAPAFPGVTFAQPDLTLLDRQAAATHVRGLQTSASAGCTVTARGWEDPSFSDPVDLNGNGIPDDAYLKYVCSFTDTVATDTVVTQEVSVEFAWKEIAGSLYGQTVMYNVAQGAQDNHGRYQRIRYNIDAKQDIRSTGVVDQASFKVRMEQQLTGEVEFQEAGESWNNAFDPVSPIALGDAIPDGDLTIGGRRYYANSLGDNLSFSISTTDPLAYSAACALAATTPPFTDGTLLGKLNNSSSQASFQVDFTSCGNYTVTVNGAYDAI